MRAGRIIAVIVGAVLAVIGFGAIVGGGAMVVMHGTQRDSAGFYQTPTERYQTSTAVLVMPLDLGAAGGDWIPVHMLGTVQIRASAADGGALFIGVAPAGQVDAWLAGTSFERLDGVRYGPWRMHTQMMRGMRMVTPPGGQGFWTASVSGAGTQTLSWPTERGAWTVVLMNADATPGVAADVRVGSNTGMMLPIGLGVGGLGLLLVGGAVALMLAALRRAEPTAGSPPVAAVPGMPTPTATAAPGGPKPYPVRLDGRLDTQLSRWLWLVKWVLVIPHAFVLALLWLAVVPLTAVAGVAILFTGRYPRSIFEFNVGVMRWTWRVSYYAFSGLGTDRYPPFSLAPDPDYPADFAVDYPQRLSRGLVLVKWWLLAIPHYLVVALLTGGWSGWFGQTGQKLGIAAGGGLIGILVLVAAVILTVSGRYPQRLFDFVMGMNRWCYRVLAYVGLLRDEYPPFRLDMGGTDPGSLPAAPPPPPRGSGELAAAAAGYPGVS
jgi:hypothetical protein